MYYVYCLRSLENGQLYKGLTNNLDRRIKEHNSGKNRSTKPYIPYELLFYEVFETRIEARKKRKIP